MGRRSTISFLILLTWLLFAIVAQSEELIRTGPIRVVGNTRTQTEIILRRIPLRTGDPFDYKLLQRGRRQVAALPGIDFVDIRVNYTPVDSSLALNVVVTEKRAVYGGLQTRRGYENDFSIGAWLNDSNFRGRGETLKVSTLFIDNTVAELSWENPWVGPDDWLLGVGARTFFRQYDYVYDDFDAEFVGTEITRFGADITLFMKVRENIRLYMTLGAQRIDSNTSGMTQRPDGDNVAIVSLGIRRDRRKSKRFPFSGGYVHIGGRAVGPGQDGFNILEGYMDSASFIRLFSSRVVLAIQLDGIYRGATSIPKYRRSHLGGGKSIRGYDYGTFHGDHSFIETGELRLPLNFTPDVPLSEVLLGVEIHGFYDWGAVWNGADLFPKRFITPSWGVGVGILNQYIDGIRVDYGWPEGGGGRWHVEVGLKF